jgi:peroxiredoxin
MRNVTSRWAFGAALCLLTAYVGCSGSNPPQQPAPVAGPKAQENSADVTPTPQPPPPPKIPEVYLSAEQDKTNLVKLGGVMPDATLKDMSGADRSLYGLLGKRATVLVFWKSGDQLYHRMETIDLLKVLDLDVARRYGDKGVNVVAVNVADKPDAAAAAIREAKVSYPMLVDPAGSYFSQVATQQLPRIYLLDPTGKVLWLDVQYSTFTGERLRQALDAVTASSRSLQ